MTPPFGKVAGPTRAGHTHQTLLYSVLMKILRIIYDFPPPWDGLSPFPYELSLAQVKLGHQVTVICGHWPKAEPKLPPLPEGLKLIRIPREPFASTLFVSTAPVAFLTILRELFFGKYDLIQGHGQLPIYYHIFRLLTWGLKQPPYQFFLHITAAGRHLMSEETKGNIKPLTKYLEWPLHEFSDGLGCAIAEKVFVTGENVRQEAIQHYNVDEKRIVVLKNGVNPNLFKPEGPNKRGELGYSSNDIVIFFDGVHNSRKGIDKIIECLPHLPPEYKLLTIGRGSDLYLQELQDLATKLNVAERVKFCGYVPYLDIPAYFRTANIFVIPSSYEGFPKVVLEALATGVPVLASGFKTTTPIQGLFQIKDDSPETLSQLIQTSLGTTVEVERVISQFSWSVMATQTVVSS